MCCIPGNIPAVASSLMLIDPCFRSIRHRWVNYRT